MQSKGELKEIDIKNRMGYFFDYIIADRDIYSINILLSKKLYETYKTILICSISYKTWIGPKPLRISFDKMDGFIRVLEGEIKHFVLFDSGLFDKFCDKIKYRINHNFRKTSIYS